MTFSFIPPRLLQRLFKTEDVLSINLFISSIVVLLIFTLLQGVPSLDRFFNSNICFCLSQRIIGIPCIGCGVTRGVFKLLDGDFIGSFLINPGSSLLVTSLLIQLPLQISTFAKKISYKVMLRFNQHLSCFILICLVIVWAIRIIFPDQIFLSI